MSDSARHARSAPLAVLDAVREQVAATASNPTEARLYALMQRMCELNCELEKSRFDSQRVRQTNAIIMKRMMTALTANRELADQNSRLRGALTHLVKRVINGRQMVGPPAVVASDLAQQPAAVSPAAATAADGAVPAPARLADPRRAQRLQASVAAARRDLIHRPPRVHRASRSPSLEPKPI
ncbi:uncharacterized protein AMSG_01029 [Thecamonas trahens ATCC 50062]|uniref:Uncharacterized protein n=1 Tax=Thecamonas trahens ATCC 50062 TaxID=461836 RepID=A0A0L0DIS4_THETB|nr:hypothetical protein AMSG_01029 [Thecamonas trahens ATCC 50062]KNC52202.1 hypothetical protein AMSG_01029 [Thecamonas trahens ATCC 50062]|eukprot:XP_013762205.1 hypothetical protein AMSG_01029 [Thecamonas trahens ATCC 50062]